MQELTDIFLRNLTGKMTEPEVALVKCPSAFRRRRLVQSVVPGLGHRPAPHHPQHHHPQYHPPQHYHLIIIITITIIIHYPPTPLFGVSCRDN